VNRFGLFWADLFGRANLFSGRLVVSADPGVPGHQHQPVQSTQRAKGFGRLQGRQGNVREQSLRALPNRAEWVLNESAETAANRSGQTLLSSGGKLKRQPRAPEAGTGWMVAAKKGTANKIGYLPAHSAIVLVCIGGLLGGDQMVRGQIWFNGKTLFTGGGLIADIPAQHRLSPSNPTFRGTLLATEGATAGTASLAQPTGCCCNTCCFRSS
jgi:cytochrome c biogenesis protein